MKTLIILLSALIAASSARGADAPPVHSKDAIKKAAVQVLSASCGLSVGDPGYLENAKILEDAGAEVVPALVELVPDKTLTTWFVYSACKCAAKHPFSKPLREALRARRSDKTFDADPGSFLGVFEYFAAFGDTNDLTWMKADVARLDDPSRRHARRHIQQLQQRLAKK